MQILDARTYQGPNLYANFRVIRFTVDLGPLEQYPSATIPGFVDRLLAAIPSLDRHTCSYDHAGGFVRRLTEDGGTWLGHVLEHVAIELQNLAGCQVSFGKTRSTGTVGQYHVVYEYEEPRVGEAAGALAMRLLHWLLPAELRPDVPDDPGFDLRVELEALIRQAQRRAFGPSTASLVRTAEGRGIPWMRLNDRSLVQFGYGHVQKRIEATVTSETRHIAVEIASDKELTNRILAQLGLPVARQEAVVTVEEALEAAAELGFPLVVKPLDANHGRGVSIGITTEQQVRVAFEQAQLHSEWVLLETFIAGFDHRLLVVNGTLVAAAMRVPGHVVGDGVHSIAQLVEQVNQDPRRGIGHEKVLTRLELDFQANRLMNLAGHTAATVLPAGETFYLRSTGNLSTGGTAIDVTDAVHPDNREMAVRAARAIGLDVCGVDFLTTDVGRSYKDVGGAICEINAAPGFRMHVAPAEGRSRDVAGAVMDMLFPPGAPTRIPIAAVTGTNGKTTATRMLAHIHKLAGATVGMTTTDGVYIDGQRTVEGDMTGPLAASMVLRDPTVTVAVLETARGGLLRAGLGYPAPDVACCLNVQGDHLGLRGVHTLAQLAEVKRIPIEVATDAVVLNADDEHCLHMADHTSARHIWYVTMNPHNLLVREHIRAGGRAVALEEGVNGQMITLYDRGTHIPLLWTHLIPATVEGLATHNVQNAMFAAAMAFAMGVRLDDIRHGLRTYDSSFFQAPGRLNRFSKHPFEVILDYGHNPAAIDAICNLVDNLVKGPTLGAGGLRSVVLSAPGDRRDEDARAIAHRAARSFDRFFLRSDDDPRGREPGAMPALLREVLEACGVPGEHIRCFDTEEPAVDAALAAAAPGDLLVIFGDDCTRCWKQIIYLGDASRPQQREPAAALAAPPPAPRPVASPAVDQAEPPPWEPPGSLIRDHRGVRFAAQRED
jgi:cyanophycin synthetase